MRVSRTYTSWRAIYRGHVNLQSYPDGLHALVMFYLLPRFRGSLYLNKTSQPPFFSPTKRTVIRRSQLRSAIQWCKLAAIFNKITETSGLSNVQFFGQAKISACDKHCVSNGNLMKELSNRTCKAKTPLGNIGDM